jgi:hypothetical protein
MYKLGIFRILRVFGCSNLFGDYDGEDDLSLGEELVELVVVGYCFWVVRSSRGITL